MDTAESSNVPEGKKDKEMDNEKNPAESEEIMKAIRFSALDTILKSMTEISLFLSDVKKDCVKGYIEGLRTSFLSKLKPTNPLEENAASKILKTILNLMPSHNSHFKVFVSNKTCNSCEMNTENPPGSYGITIIADSLGEIKSEYEELKFDRIIKLIGLNLNRQCEKEGCGKPVRRMLHELPSVFTIGLQWENNDTREEISETISVLETEIDITQIYEYKGDCTSTKYRLVSMVCLWGNEYNYIAYGNNGWIRYFGSDEKEVIGDWKSVPEFCAQRTIRPKILFFENETNIFVNGQRWKGRDKCSKS